MRFSLSIGQVLAIVGCVCLAVSAGAARKPKGESKPVVANDVVCDACIGPGEISPGTVGIAELDQGFSDLVDAAVNDIDANTVAIQDNANTIAAVATVAVPRVKANGQDIGTFLNIAHDNDPENLFRRPFWALSDTGYVFRVSASDTFSGPAGELQRRLLWFETPNCSGSAYVAATRDPDFPLTAHYRSGAVFASEDLNDNPGVYYTPKGSAPVSVTLQSQTSTSAGITFCNAQTETVDAFVVVPNDPLVTDVPNQRFFDPPITLGVQIFQVSPP